MYVGLFCDCERLVVVVLLVLSLFRGASKRRRKASLLALSLVDVSCMAAIHPTTTPHTVHGQAPCHSRRCYSSESHQETSRSVVVVVSVFTISR